jgi:hypothetical protein
MQTDAANFAVHQLNQQTRVGVAGAESLGQMGASGALGGGGTMNPSAMMAGMAVGGAVGQQVAGMMGGMMQGVQQPGMTPPPPSVVQYSVAVNGQTTGPFTLDQLAAMAAGGQFTAQSMV